MTFTTGDCVEILCRDGRYFVGFLLDVTEHYVLLSGPRGFASDDIKRMTHV
jgi:hypothetical protein